MTLTRSQFLFDLPPGRIAQAPAEPRDSARMMVLRRADRRVEHAVFADFPAYLEPPDLLVVNDTRVIPARLFGRKEPGGARVEVLLLREEAPRLWKAMARPGRRLQRGAVVRFSAEAEAVVRECLEDGTRLLEFRVGMAWDRFLDECGLAPLPPYIRPHPPGEDPAHRARYQTVYARMPGSVAAPTAGMHFTPELLDRVSRNGNEVVRVTLHVGMGTFRPVEKEEVGSHVMDSESYEITPQAAIAINRALDEKRRVLAVGTTSVRTLESAAARSGGRVSPGRSDTSLFVLPGYSFQVVGALLTNFHLPGSTLIMLTSAFAGLEWVLECYREAVERGYRFFSYGDCMLVL